MKRIMLVLLAVLLLAGCSRTQTFSADQTAPTAEPTEPVNLYIANSSVEQQSEGAVKAYVPEEAEYIGMAIMGDQVVLVSDLSELTLIDAKTGNLGVSAKVGETISCEDTDFTVSDKGLSFYRDDGRELVFLNTGLQQESKTEIPQGILGHPSVSHTNQEIYYCADKEVRALHMQTGISRLVKSQVCQSIELVGSYLDGMMLACRVTEENGNVRMIYIDSANGQTLDDVSHLLRIQTGGTKYLVSRMEGIVKQQIYGSLNGENRCIQLDVPLNGVFSMDGGYHWYMEEGALHMDYYDFTTGTHMGHVRLVGVSEPIAVDADGEYIWILAKEGKRAMLYRWDVTASPTGDETVYTEPLYTRDAPDTEGMKACAKRAAALSETYGVSFHVGAGAMEVTGGYELEEEYLVPALNQMLDRIEALMAQMPEGFLQQSLAKGKLHVSLVRSIGGNKDYVQFYENGDGYVILACSQHIEENFLHGVGYVIDSHVLGNSRDYDDWKKWNPDDFDYDYNYYEYHSHNASPYLEEESRYFADSYGMTFPHEDRCRIFVYAMLPGNEKIFASEAMQDKLRQVCKGIREAYGYEKSGDIYPWEQYLEEPLVG